MTLSALPDVLELLLDTFEAKQDLRHLWMLYLLLPEQKTCHRRGKDADSRQRELDGDQPPFRCVMSL